MGFQGIQTWEIGGLCRIVRIYSKYSKKILEALTLLQLNQRIANLVVTPDTQNIWVTAELSDVAVRGGHCYMELLQKDAATGRTVAKARAAIWANQFQGIRAGFYAATGQDFVTGLKVMVRLCVSMHPVYGMSLVINAVNPDYTMGDLIRRRNEMIARLKAECIYDMNRSLVPAEPTLRIAVVSAPGAAGYGDFMNQLASDPMKLRFVTRLFPAVMQGERTAQSVKDALSAVEREQHLWDVVVIIRGGGATSDLLGFEDYDLAATVAQFPLPVIVGIGHERDVTILDYVACVRVKTPTAAAEWLLAKGKECVMRLDSLGRDIALAVSGYLSGCKEQLGAIEGRIPALPGAMLARAASRNDRLALALQQLSARTLAPHTAHLDRLALALGRICADITSPRKIHLEKLGTTLSGVALFTLASRRNGLDGMARLLAAMSPESTLKRGYSITRVNGHAVSDASALSSGDIIHTTLAAGTIISVVK